MSDPLVSCVISTWNRKEDVAQIVANCIRSTYRNTEVIVVDNCSTDGTVDHLKELHTMTPEYPLGIVVMNDSNHGACETFNIGFKLARGKYILVLDDDVVLAEDTIEKLVKRMEELPPDVAAISPYVAFADNKIQYPKNIRDQNEHEMSYFHGACAMMRTDALFKTRLYDENYWLYANEVELTLQFMYHRYRVLFTPITLVYHKVSGESRKSNRRMYFVIRNLFWCIFTHFPFPVNVFELCKLVKGVYTDPSVSKGNATNALLSGVLGLPTMLWKREVVSALNSRKHPFFSTSMI